MHRKLGDALRAFGIGWAAALVAFALLSSGCTSNSAKKQYLLAEKLWTDGRYAAAVVEFDKVAAKDPRGKLGSQALYRSATTQMLFLSQYAEAVRKFKAFAEIPGVDAELAWDAQKQIGEILFFKTEQYDQAIQHYEAMVRQRPTAPEAPELIFRTAKSHFYLWQFDDAVDLYRQIGAKYPGTAWAEKAAYEIGVSYFTRGEQGNTGREREKGAPNVYQQAIDAFQRFIKQFPQSTLIPEARFGIASCLEETDQLDAAYRAYESLKDVYPSPKVIIIKLTRIRERQAQRSH
jgi:TolA-binding protein